MSKIRVLCVDDSALMRQLMTEIVNGHADMEMVATAPDPLVARDLIKNLIPGADAGRRDAAHGRAGFPREADAPAADAGGDGLFADRQRLGNRCARWSWARWTS